jgi:hypothetical protein
MGLWQDHRKSGNPSRKWQPDKCLAGDGAGSDMRLEF